MSMAQGCPALRLDGDTLAYVLSTSGTTGQPKGVAQRHGAVLGHVDTWRARLALGAGDRVALFASYGYDAAVQDVFGALLSGAALHPLELRGPAESLCEGNANCQPQCLPARGYLTSRCHY